MPGTAPSDKTDALIEAASQCFAETFNGVIYVHLLLDDRGARRDLSNSGTKTAPELQTGLIIDGHKNPPSIQPLSAEDSKTIPKGALVAGECLWRTSAQTLERILAGGRHLSAAFISGHIAIAGDMSVMTRVTMPGITPPNLHDTASSS